MLGAQGALAQPMNGCPDGQAMQAADPSGKTVVCVVIPAPVDVSGLESQIAAERTAREGMDVILQDAIDELRPTVIEGTYAFTGTQTCLNSSFGFSPDLTPLPSSDPNRAAVVSHSSAVTTGFRTFHANGTGTTQLRTRSIIAPGVFYTSSGFSGITSGGQSFPGGPAIPGGNASVVDQAANFTWRIEGNRLIIEDESAPGVFIAGNRVGWTALVTGVPPQVGVLGKDLRLISVTHEAFAVETTATISPPEVQPPQQFSTPRICARERTLRKM
ncbi:MAG TPA: hypothetical protein VHG88_00455 [Burkholderiales bacterium]|nr:hypothetical protein [Burkholderiales bacterium]